MTQSKKTTEELIVDVQQSGDNDEQELATIWTSSTVGDARRVRVIVDGKEDGAPQNRRLFIFDALVICDSGPSLVLGQAGVGYDLVASGITWWDVALEVDGTDLKLVATYASTVDVNWRIRVTLEDFE